MTRHMLSMNACLLALCGGLVVGCASSKEAEASKTKKSQMKEASTTGNESSDADDSETTSAPKASESETGPPSAEGPNPGKPASETAGQIPRSELEEFIRVSKRMRKVQVETKAKLKGAESREDAKSIQNEARAEMKSTLESSSLSERRYREIGMRLKSDPKLRARLKKIEREMSSGTPSESAE